jgi:hypothetical protein
VQGSASEGRLILSEHRKRKRIRSPSGMDILIEGVWFSGIASVITELLQWVWLMMLSRP